MDISYFLTVMTNETQETINNVNLTYLSGGGRFIWHPCYGSEQYGRQYMAILLCVVLFKHNRRYTTQWCLLLSYTRTRTPR